MRIIYHDISTSPLLPRHLETLVYFLILLLILDAPVPPSLPPHPAHPLPEVALPDRPRVPLVDDARDHQRRGKHPHVAALHGLPPPPLDADLPQAVDADARAVEEHVPPVPALDPRPQAGEEAAEEEALRREHVPREVRLEEADGRPGGGDGARDEGRAAEGLDDDGVDAGERRVVEALELEEDGEARVEEDEETGRGREGVDPEGEICAQAGRVGRMEGGAGERSDERMSLGCEGGE